MVREIAARKETGLIITLNPKTRHIPKITLLSTTAGDTSFLSLIVALQLFFPPDVPMPLNIVVVEDTGLQGTDRKPEHMETGRNKTVARITTTTFLITNTHFLFVLIYRRSTTRQQSNSTLFVQSKEQS